MTQTEHGTLWLVPSPLDFATGEPAPLSATLPDDVLAQATRITHWIVENAKTARAVLSHYGERHPLPVSMRDMSITELPHRVHKQGDAGFDARALLAPALAGEHMGLMSEAGVPAVADPGAAVVRAAHDLNIPVMPLVGPSSLLLALMASGLNGQSFAFVGYLPIDAADRARRIRELEALALRQGQTQMFIETPYRNATLFSALVSALAPDTRLAVSCGVTLAQGWHRSAPVRDWRECPPATDDWRLPAVFLIGR